jgi:hypothetical protein
LLFTLENCIFGLVAIVLNQRLSNFLYDAAESFSDGGFDPAIFSVTWPNLSFDLHLMECFLQFNCLQYYIYFFPLIFNSNILKQTSSSSSKFGRSLFYNLAFSFAAYHKPIKRDRTDSVWGRVLQW